MTRSVGSFTSTGEAPKPSSLEHVSSATFMAFQALSEQRDPFAGPQNPQKWPDSGLILVSLGSSSRSSELLVSLLPQHLLQAAPTLSRGRRRRRRPDVIHDGDVSTVNQTSPRQVRPVRPFTPHSRSCERSRSKWFQHDIQHDRQEAQEGSQDYTGWRTRCWEGNAKREADEEAAPIVFTCNRRLVATSCEEQDGIGYAEDVHIHK